jgi:hypothetical protein
MAACPLNGGQVVSQTNVTVPSNDDSGMGAGMIIGLLLAVIIIGFLIWWFLLNGGGGTPAESTAPLQSVVESIAPGSVAPASVAPSVSPSVSPSVLPSGT